VVRAPAGIRQSQATTRREFELPADTPAVLSLDEPTAGIAQRETEAFGPLLRDIQAAFGCSILVIEHDMPMVMSLSDRVYCLEAGSVIAEGSPDAVRNDPLVIAAYLGTDERTINRSDTGRAAETIAGV
jgi:ABC-type branched-subunit amino acid transport system ATPase component